MLGQRRCQQGGQISQLGGIEKRRDLGISLGQRKAPVPYRSLGETAPARGDRQPQGLEVLKGAFVISLEHGVLPFRYPLAEQRGPDATSIKSRPISASADLKNIRGL